MPGQVLVSYFTKKWAALLRDTTGQRHYTVMYITITVRRETLAGGKFGELGLKLQLAK